MKMKLKSTNCKWCGKNYEVGFYGAGPVYCSHECSKVGRSKRATTGSYYVQKDKPCIVCKRSILDVGLRKSVNKYCSKRCMHLGQRIRDGREFTTIKIPVKDIPNLFSQI